MTTFNHYTIHNSWTIVGSGTYRPTLWIFRDKKIQKKSELEKLFLGSYKTFRLRVRDFGKLETDTTIHDANAMQVMLGGLVRAKKQIKKERGG